MGRAVTAAFSPGCRFTQAHYDALDKSEETTDDANNIDSDQTDNAQTENTETQPE